jgi:hypothetical protein
MNSSNQITTVRHDDGPLDPAALIAAYEHGIDELRSSVAGMSQDQLVARPVPGKWSTLEVVCHLAGTEIYLSDRIERTLVLEHPTLIAVDERPYPERLHYQSFVLSEQLDLFTALRRHTARVLRLQPAEAWQRTAVHNETGEVTVRMMVQQATRHVTHHVWFIAEKRVALASKLSWSDENAPYGYGIRGRPW